MTILQLISKYDLRAKTHIWIKLSDSAGQNNLFDRYKHDESPNLWAVVTVGCIWLMFMETSTDLLEILNSRVCQYNVLPL